MRKLLIVTDPIPKGVSVQLELTRSLAASLKYNFQVYATSSYISKSAKETLSRDSVIILNSNGGHIIRMLGKIGIFNESFFWVMSWLRETTTGKNYSEAHEKLSSMEFDYVLNISNTVPVECNAWWIQGSPLDVTLEKLASSNNLAKILRLIFGGLIGKLDRSLLNKYSALSPVMVANSDYTAKCYEAVGIKVGFSLATFKDFSKFYPTTSTPSGDYVLTYVGKETEIAPLAQLAKNGVKLVGFGSKTPPGQSRDKLTKIMNFRGYVTPSELLELYSNALFTAFPFTEEPLGYVPIESMMCGTPVLTYNKQGPKETVLNDETGWLVDDANEFVKVGTEIWSKKSYAISRERCIEHSKNLILKNSDPDIFFKIFGMKTVTDTKSALSPAEDSIIPESA